jgi:AcrR family transcriptional regulator
MSTRGRSVPVAGSTSPRERLLASAGALARLDDWQRITVERICDHAGVSKRTYYQLFADRQACLEAAMEHAEMSLRVDAESGPQDELPLVLRRLASALHADPTRAWLAVVQPRAQRGAPRAPDDGAVATRAFVALAADRLGTKRGVGSLEEAVEPAAYLELAQRLGRHAALREAQRPVQLDIVTPPRFNHRADVQTHEPPPRLSMLARSTLLHLDAHPGDSNCAVAAAVGIRLESQASRHLRTLEKSQLVRHTRKGRTNHWYLTDAGRSLVDRLR